MVPSVLRGRRAPRRCRPPETYRDDGWRLLVRIALVRWVAVALGVLFALAGPHPGVPAWPLLALAAMATAYNTAVTCHRRLPRLRVRLLTRVTVAGDFAWITGAAALLFAGHDGASIGVGYVALGSECGLLLGWRGALAAMVAGVAALVGLGTAMAPGRDMSSPGELAYMAATVAVSAALAAVGSAELRAQQRDLNATNAALVRHAHTDHLTGLGNARAIDEALSALRDRTHALLLVDVDGMRWANTVYGHQAGDEMLLGVARVLAAIREPGELVGRLAEDKFVMLLPDADQAHAAAVGEEVRAAMHSVAVSGAQLRVSIGCAWSRGDDEPALTMARADDALYAAKARGGDRVVVQGAARGRGRWGLREAVESVLDSDRGVYSVYQCIVRLESRAIAGWEALSRPHHWPADASVEAMFLTAHHMGRARDLDWRCRRNALWEASRLDAPLFMNVNVAGLVDPVHGVDQMLLLCEWAGRAPQSVVLELSERDAMPDLRRLRMVLAEYREAGFRFALDDLGEGQTSLEAVLAARPEFIKLARPLVQSAHQNVSSRLAVRGLVTFAHDLGAVVIAEGVENEDDALLCATLRVDLAQGWLFGRPLPADRLPS